MSREWKAGDVVTATVDGRPNVRVVAGWSRYDPRLRWCEMSPRWGDGDDDECWFMPSQVTDHRPLAVIDPEDREQVERLWAGWKAAGAYRAKGRESEAVDSMQAALREFANPARPKPEEPQGDGAVVEDASGHRWVRIAGSAVDSPPWRHRGHTARLWDNISAVRILSEGVQP